MGATFVVPDCHGNVELVAGLLQQETLIDENFDRVVHHPDYGEVTIVQLGDLCNCISSSVDEDKACLGFAPDWFDVYLVGNHEYPYFAGYNHGFSGFWRDVEIERALYWLHDRKLIQVAYSAGDVLITHAGLTSWARNQLGNLGNLGAAHYSVVLNKLWDLNPRHPVLSAVGRERGGWRESGGILWAHWGETLPRNLRQVVGHTVGKEIRQRGKAYCIDLGAGKRSSRIAGCWISDGVITTVEHTIAEEAAA